MDAPRTLAADIGRKISEWTGRALHGVARPRRRDRNAGRTPCGGAAEAEERRPLRPCSSRAVLARFPGAEIVDVQIRGEEPKAVRCRRRPPPMPPPTRPTIPPSATKTELHSHQKERLMRDIMGMMSKAKELQAKMQEMQEQVSVMEVSGSSGAGLVSVTMTAKGDLLKIAIDPSLLKAEEAEILEDLIIAAHADARAQGREGDGGEDAGTDRRPRPAARPQAAVLEGAGRRRRAAVRGFTGLSHDRDAASPPGEGRDPRPPLSNACCAEWSRPRPAPGRLQGARRRPREHHRPAQDLIAHREPPCRAPSPDRRSRG